MSEDAAQAIITGGEGDLARAIRGELQRGGMNVDAPGRVELDVSSSQAVRDYFEKRQPELVICNAGITRDRPLARMAEADWDEVMAVNLQGAIHCAEAAISSMKSRAGDLPRHIVLISSFSALHPPIGQVAYATAKAALLGLVSDLAVRHGADGIRVNAVLPGFLETKMTEGVSAERRQQVLDHHALGRFNTPERVAAFIRFLHQEMPHTSGQTFQLDSRLANR